MIRFACFECGDSFAVGRKVVRFGGGLNNCFGCAAVDGNALEKMILSGVDEVQPFAVMRTDRHTIVDAKSKTQKVCAI